MIFVLLVFSFALALSAIALGLTFWPIAIWAIHRRAKTWIGLDYDSARSRINGAARVTEGTWQLDSFSGRMLVVAYPRYTLRLSFGSDDRVVYASIEFSKPPLE